ncbi:hypothetical protein PCH_Pc20g01930 [Penicillium rubens Wisconsin 54-1255]|uniref:Uncharacterized protein n=1 Tax=Penicillium rubens (strain ATCC 28089 / DSM 1075 / NRRL 1951 / Wisconsin 54-1255) TaxID=500485 RepID=B6HE26_PENRW|nr:hypothetical protein PCH_Pc20g01930 [Penicillium rubens Wisconsin 54-1255]
MSTPASTYIVIPEASGAQIGHVPSVLRYPLPRGGADRVSSASQQFTVQPLYNLPGFIFKTCWPSSLLEQILEKYRPGTMAEGNPSTLNQLVQILAQTRGIHMDVPNGKYV